MNNPKTGVLFVCMGNICRSPTAEGVFNKLLEKNDLSDHFLVDSAGTTDYHQGGAPDRRAQAAARLRGVDLSSLRARQIKVDDLSRFDYVLAMDANNLERIRSLQTRAQATAQVQLLLDYARHADTPEVPDPYFGGSGGFEHVLDLIEDACQGLLDQITSRHVTD